MERRKNTNVKGNRTEDTKKVKPIKIINKKKCEEKQKILEIWKVERPK